MARRMSVHGDFLKEGDLQCKGTLFIWHNRHYMLMEDGALHQLKCHLTASSAVVRTPCPYQINRSVVLF
jgi:hypothetical protein